MEPPVRVGWCILAIMVAAVVLGFAGVFAGRGISRATVAARFDKDLPAYAALLPALPPNSGGQSPQNLPSRVTGKVKGKIVVVNVNEREIDDLYFALPDDLRASKPEEVATVVLVTWEERSTEWPLSRYGDRFIMIGHVKVFDWKRKSEIASSTILGDVPDRGRWKPRTGPKPEAQVLTFLTGLPRE
jgi:hypothetical protein